MERDDSSPQDRTKPEPGKRFAIFAVALVVALGIGAVILINSAGAPARSAAPTQHGSPSGTELPAGGITRETAIDIAIGGTQMPDGSFVSASARFDSERGRWVWEVSYGYSAGPTSGAGARVVIDFFTGEVLDRQLWVS